MGCQILDNFLSISDPVKMTGLSDSIMCSCSCHLSVVSATILKSPLLILISYTSSKTRQTATSSGPDDALLLIPSLWEGERGSTDIFFRFGWLNT